MKLSLDVHDIHPIYYQLLAASLDLDLVESKRRASHNHKHLLIGIQTTTFIAVRGEQTLGMR